MRQCGFSFLKNFSKEFGGDLLSGKRKSIRPLSTKHPLHLVIKSSGSTLFKPGSRALENLIRHHADKHHIKIYRISLNWSHTHILLKLPSREAYRAFIRTLTARIVDLFSKQTGRSLKGLFDLRPFTRVLSWGRDFRSAMLYHDLNDQEALGLIVRKKTRNKNSKKNPDQNQGPPTHQ